ncbi:MAG: bifunctional hydroxymethylpyrimidine kinase/phosphomethylpyrimidine kinase [Proteobacteria bacterium]|nr:bifunctional hydroxymethylpyrimidine kinase/phosphomethylpyrimidine kinase [Pseudomonadota bacterium]
MKNVLTIAGFDPSGWAGVSADLKTFADLGVDGAGAVTALTAQNKSRVTGVEPVSPKFIRKEITTLLETTRFDAVKIGMLGDSAVAAMLRRLFKKVGFENVVLDPVLRATSGPRLLDAGGLSELKRLLPAVRVVTPNIDEAEALAGIKITGIADMESAARKIHALGAKTVLVTGGHLAGAPVDVLYDSKGFTHFKGVRLKGRPERFHGTGCILSSALAAYLARGQSVKSATKAAQKYLIETIKARK